MRYIAILMTSIGVLSSGVQAQMKVEYVAHACFVIESPQGVRLVVDPYNGNTWMGYSFPEGIEVDGVAITHPHYDHDASYYFDETAPVFREPGQYRLDDVRLVGVEGEHAGAARFRSRGSTPFNTIWVVEVDGVRLAHLGDNGALSSATIDALGRIDILVARATGAYADIEPVLRRLGVSVLIPNHYRLPSISDLPEGLRTVDEWLGEHPARRLEANARSYERDNLPPASGPEVHVFTPSASVQAWPKALHDAWKEVEQAGDLPETDSAALAHYRKAVELAPEVMKFRWHYGRLLAGHSRVSDAVATLEEGLAGIPRGDWTDELRVRSLLGRLYAKSGDSSRAAAQYRWVASQRRTYAAKEWETAREFLDTRTHQ